MYFTLNTGDSTGPSNYDKPYTTVLLFLLSMLPYNNEAIKNIILKLKPDFSDA